MEYLEISQIKRAATTATTKKEFRTEMVHFLACVTCHCLHVVLGPCMNLSLDHKCLHWPFVACPWLQFATVGRI